MWQCEAIALGKGGDGRDEAGLKDIQASVDVGILEVEFLGCGLGVRGFVCVVALLKVENVRVVGEIGIAQLGVAVKPQPLPNEAVEVARQEVGEVEGAEVRAVVAFKGVAAIEFVTVRAGDANDVVVARQQRVECAPCAAVGIANQNEVEARGSRIEQGGHGGRDALRQVMQLRGYSRQFKIPCLPLRHGDHLAHNGPAGNDANLHAHLH